MNKNKALKILEEVQKRKLENNKIDLLQDSFKEQTDFVNDTSKLKYALTCRRAAKSFSAALMLSIACLKEPLTYCAYMGLTKDSAKNVIIPHLKSINKKFNCQAKFYKSPASVQFKNGSTIHFFGINDTEEEREKLLGQHFKLAVIDEGASYTIDLKATIKDYIRPTLLDDDGQLIIIGTPGNLRNYFCDISEGRVPGWSGHFWLADKNPYVARQYLNEIKELKEQYPNIELDPGFQQHYMGKWTIDTEKKFYKYNRGSNLIAEFKLPDFSYILSMDLGWEDPNSFVVGAYHQNDPNLYIIESYSESHMFLDDTINKIKELELKYNFSHYLIDSANKQYVEELRYRTRKPFQAATKSEKMKYIHMMNSDFIKGKIKIVEPKCQSLINEYDILVKLDDKSDNYQQVAGSQPDHNADAALYLWRQSYHYISQPKDEKPPIHSEAKVDEFWDREADRINNKKEKNFLESDWE